MPAARYSEKLLGPGCVKSSRRNAPSPRSPLRMTLSPQTVGNWVARYRKEHATDQDRQKASESAEIAKLRAEVRELGQENEFLKKAAAWLAKERP